MKLPDIQQQFNQILERKSDSEILNHLFAYAYRKGNAIALWRNPGKDKVSLVMEIGTGGTLLKPDLEELEAGFLFAPFQTQANSPAILIQNHVAFDSISGIIQFSSHLPELAVEELLQDLNQENSLADSKTGGFHVNPKPDLHRTEKEEYVNLVSHAVREARKDTFDKVVPARSEIITLTETFNVIDSFNRLCEFYPQAMVSLVSIPNVGTWMGATPEMLISTDSNHIFKTVALAGTQPVDEETDLMEVAWTQKEIEEQALVGRYVINCFKKIRLRDFVEKGPRTIKAGSLAHLVSTYLVDMKKVNFMQLGTVMLELLHPTSAVCGMPIEPALDFILKGEGFNRQYFSGYLGPVNMNNESHLFVNIRCMQLLKEKAILYAGAGVTSHSKPEKEWDETGYKLQTMLKILQ